MKGWEAKLPDAHQALARRHWPAAMEFGRRNRFMHIWAYKSMDQRMQVRDEARKEGVWPPPGGGDGCSPRRTRS